MTGVWPWIAAVVVVGAVVAGWRVRVWAQRRTAVHAAAVQQVLDGDRVIQQLEQQFRQPAREHEGRRDV